MRAVPTIPDVRLLHSPAGYNYFGTETMYSGITGTQLEAKIFFGVIHYQRLRHMVSDKWQVRTGSVLHPAGGGV